MLNACSVCGDDQFTPVCEYNRFLVSGNAPDQHAKQAEYALCHRCGVVYARRRPVGPRFRFLLERFEETIGRASAVEQRGINGSVYLYNEPDERDFLDTSKSLLTTLNAFHLQTFDVASLGRALQSAGFEPIFIGHCHDNCVALARVAPDRQAPWTPLTKRERARRVTRYSQARDRAIVSLPDHLRLLFASEWEGLVERAFAAGTIDFDGDGKLRVLKRA